MQSTDGQPRTLHPNLSRRSLKLFLLTDRLPPRWIIFPPCVKQVPHTFSWSSHLSVTANPETVSQGQRGHLSRGLPMAAPLASSKPKPQKPYRGSIDSPPATRLDNFPALRRTG